MRTDKEIREEIHRVREMYVKGIHESSADGWISVRDRWGNYHPDPDATAIAKDVAVTWINSMSNSLLKLFND